MQYLKNGYIRPDTKAPGLQKARERLRVLSMSDKERSEYEYYLYNKVYEEDVVETAREDGWFEGYDEGEAKGRAESMEQVAGRLKAIGMDDKTIAKVTGLSAEETEGL